MHQVGLLFFVDTSLRRGMSMKIVYVMLTVNPSLRLFLQFSVVWARKLFFTIFWKIFYHRSTILHMTICYPGCAVLYHFPCNVLLCREQKVTVKSHIFYWLNIMVLFYSVLLYYLISTKILALRLISNTLSTLDHKPTQKYTLRQSGWEGSWQLPIITSWLFN